jgi:hypothetical protein
MPISLSPILAAGVDETSDCLGNGRGHGTPRGRLGSTQEIGDSLIVTRLEKVGGEVVESSAFGD